MFTEQSWRIADDIVARLIADVAADWDERGVTDTDLEAQVAVDRLELGTLASAVRGHDEARSQNKTKLTRLLQLELGGIKLAAMTAAPQIYAEVDRLDAERAFRSALLIPTVALAVAVRNEELLWGLLALAISAMLAVQGLRRGNEAGSVLVEALDIGTLDAPVLDRLRRKARGVQPTSESP
ncbi:MAG: hypothetical protein QOH12_1147 [Solirubrobacteraceae bacterium]|nr:hypothetical protein [Solirubrobacteraceae bacterium]